MRRWSWIDGVYVEVIFRNQIFWNPVSRFLFRVNPLRFSAWINVHFRTVEQPIISRLIDNGYKHQSHIKAFCVARRAERAVFGAIGADSPNN